ncbi:MAG: hypothetical protein AAGG44_16825 [Planctomycetota bacterium]
MSERWVPIPKQFHSLYHEGPFTRCIDCGRDLMDPECTYCIERVFRGTEPICEMAICLDCRAKISEELSKDSMMRIQAYVEERLDFELRYEATTEWEGSQIERWIDHCALLKIPVSECRGYQIAALCKGNMMSIDMLPMMISGTATEEMQRLMSKKTRERLGDMVQDFFGQPSEFADGPESYSPMVW